MTIAELFARLEFKIDKLSEAQVDKKLSKFQKRMKGLGKLARSAFTGIGGALVAGFGVAAKDAIDFDRALTRLDVDSQGAVGNIDQFRQKVLGVSEATGLAKEDVLEAATSFVALTGDGSQAAQSMEAFARIAVASGSSLDDIAKAAAALQQNLKITPDQFEDAFSVLIKSGKLGAVELKNMAGILPGLTPLMERFAGGSGISGLQDLASGLQLARQGFGSAEETATGLESLMGAIVKNASKIEKAGGFKVFTKNAKTGKKELKGFREIVDLIGNSKLGTDDTKLIKAFGRKEAFFAYLQLRKNKGAWEQMSDATKGAKDAAEDYAKVQASKAAQVDRAWNKFKVTVAEAFTPERIEAFATALKGALEIAAGLVGTFVDIGEFLGRFAPETADKLTTGNTMDKFTTVARGVSYGLDHFLPGNLGEGVREKLPEVQTATMRMEGEDTRSAMRAGVQQAIANITINAGNADAEETARIAKREFQKANDAQARELVAAGAQ